MNIDFTPSFTRDQNFELNLHDSESIFYSKTSTLYIQWVRSIKVSYLYFCTQYYPVGHFWICEFWEPAALTPHFYRKVYLNLYVKPLLYSQPSDVSFFIKRQLFYRFIVTESIVLIFTINFNGVYTYNQGSITIKTKLIPFLEVKVGLNYNLFD